MRRVLLLSAFGLLVGFAMSGTAHAQSAITGQVKDATGAVLPGVTVEAASEALIEKVRIATTDGQGLYRIIDLRPGLYVVTFTLPGFQTVRRDGIQLAAEFTATVNADLRVGEIAEAITVTGETPLVDTTTAVHTAVLDREAIETLPSGRMIQSIGQLIPGVNLNLPDVGGARAMQQTYMSTHGMSAANNTVLVDGMMVNGLQGDGAIQAYHNEAASQEMSYQTSGISADTSAGGIRLNLIPREGGNRFTGDFRISYRPNRWQSDNLTQRHIDRGVTAGNAIDRIIDATFSQGGPIKRDKLWFFFSAKYNTVNTYIANTFFDDGSQGIDDQYIKQGLARVTWQATPRNKFSAYWDEIDKYRGHDMQSGYDPETAALQWFSPAYHTAQVKWSSTVSSRVFVEAGWSSNIEYYTNSYQEGVEKPRFSPEWYAGATRTDSGYGLRTTAGVFQTTQSPERQNMQASLSYVTGAHNFKFGFQYTWGDFMHTGDVNADLTQQYRSTGGRAPFSVPESVILRNTPLIYGERLNRDVGLYAQDSWKLKRLTINGGIRWENVKAQVLAGTSPAGRWAPERQFEEIENVPNWKDWAPRFSMVYDLLGTGRTALKYSLNRYNRQTTTGIADDYNPLRSVTSSALPWRDVNGDDVAQGYRTFHPDGTASNCVFLSPGCEIDMRNLAPNFGISALNQYDNYPRLWNLESALELQHELFRSLSVTGSWFRGSFHDFDTTINQSYTHADFRPFTFYNPITGEPIEVFARTLQNRPTRNLDTLDPERKRTYESFVFEFNTRGRGARLFGGVTFERERDVSCNEPDDPNSLRFCDDRQNDIPFRTGFKLSGVLPLPWDVQLSGVFQSNNGTSSSRVMSVVRGRTEYPDDCPAPCPAGQVIMPNSVFGQSSMSVALVPGDTVFTERINQLDLRVSKTFSMGRLRLTPSLEIFNVNNTDAVISYVGTNVLTPTTFLKPNSIMQGRMVGVNVQSRW